MAVVHERLENLDGHPFAAVTLPLWLRFGSDCIVCRRVFPRGYVTTRVLLVPGMLVEIGIGTDTV